MKKLKTTKTAIWGLCAFMLTASLIFYSCSDDDAIDVTSITLSETSITLQGGESVTLDVAIKPDDASKAKLVWTSSDESIATVSSSGEILGVKAGIATITVTAENGGKTDECTVKVYDVYVSGYEINLSSSSWVAKLWKNGVAQNLSNGTNIAYANSVFVSGNDVYVAGTDNGIAKFWKNGVAQNLTNGSTTAEAHSVYVSGNDVYVAGVEGDYGKLWKNEVAQNLTTGSTASEAYSVFVSGGDVFVAGAVSDGSNLLATLWKNGVAQYLTDRTIASVAQSVFVVRPE